MVSILPLAVGADADGTDFSNHLGQQVFGAIAAASEDVQLIFGKDLKDLASLFMVWTLTVRLFPPLVILKIYNRQWPI